MGQGPVAGFIAPWGSRKEEAGVPRESQEPYRYEDRAPARPGTVQYSTGRVLDFSLRLPATRPAARLPRSHTMTDVEEEGHFCATPAAHGHTVEIPAGRGAVANNEVTRSSDVLKILGGPGVSLPRHGGQILVRPPMRCLTGQERVCVDAWRRSASVRTQTWDLTLIMTRGECSASSILFCSLPRFFPVYTAPGGCTLAFPELCREYIRHDTLAAVSPSCPPIPSRLLIFLLATLGVPRWILLQSS